MVRKLTFLLFVLSVPCSMATAQKYAGAFENNADLQLYVIQLNADQPASLLRIENFKNPPDAPQVSEAIGTVYSQQYQRVFAIYEDNAGMVVAHAIELSENQALAVKASFGAVYEPNYNSFFGVILSETDQLVAFRASY